MKLCQEGECFQARPRFGRALLSSDSNVDARVELEGYLSSGEGHIWEQAESIDPPSL